jgi:hypothetical protein
MIAAAGCSVPLLAQTCYVSTGGNDAEDGQSEKTAWRTIAYAAKQAKAGDTVLVAPGNYGAEQVVFANSGEEGKPIVLKGNGGRPALKNTIAATAFLVEGKKHIRIENFDVFGYSTRVKVTKSSHVWVRNVNGLGPGGCLNFFQGVENSWFDSCYVEDTNWNAIMVLGTLPSTAPPSPNNTVTNCVTVRGGHASIDIHTNCPNTHVAGCIVRERGTEGKVNGKPGGPSACGLFVHNAPMASPRIVGNSVTDTFIGISIVGGFDGLVADNLIYGTIWDILNERSTENTGVAVKDKQYLFAGRNVISDNIVFDVKKLPAIQNNGTPDNLIARNYADGKNAQNDPDYYFYRYLEADSSGNTILDPARGRQTIGVRDTSSCVIRFTPGFYPLGTRFILKGVGKDAERTLGPEGVSFGPLSAEIYTGVATVTAPSGATKQIPVSNAEPANCTLQAIAPGDAPAPIQLRAVPLPEAAGGAVIVWADVSDKETGFAVERRLEGEKDFKEIAQLPADSTRYIDKDAARSKAFYRARAIYGDKKSEYSNTDELVRYGYWFTERTGLSADALSAFAQVEKGELKTLIVQKAKRVERKAAAVEGASAFSLLEAFGIQNAQGEIKIARQEPTAARTLLIASKPVEATLYWRDGHIRGYVEGEGNYSLELYSPHKRVKGATLNGTPAHVTFDAKERLLSINMPESGYLEVELQEE